MGVTSTTDERPPLPDPELERVVVDLSREFSGRIDTRRIADCVLDTRDRFGQPRITQYLPVLVRREARDQLIRGLA